MTGIKEEIYAELARKVREIPLDKPGPSHEWEELVQMMCDSEDAELQDIGQKENEVLKQIEAQKK